MAVTYKTLITEMIKLDEKNIGDNTKYYGIKHYHKNTKNLL
jgi:hypothetical protein